MAQERYWSSVPPVSLTAQGTAQGLITVTSTAGFKVKQDAVLESPTQPAKTLQVKRVLSPTQLELGPTEGNLDSRSNLSAYDITATLRADRQRRPSIPLHEAERAVYEEEPASALRVMDVDQFGRPRSVENPLPVALSTGSISIDSIQAELQVQLSHITTQEKPVADSVRVGDGANELGVNPDGSLNVNIVQSPSVSVGGLEFAFNEVLSIPAGVETTVITHVATGPSGSRLTRIDCSGENVAEFTLKVDGQTVMKKRSWWTTFNTEFVFETQQNGLKLLPGQVLTVTVAHNRPLAGDFNATLTFLS